MRFCKLSLAAAFGASLLLSACSVGKDGASTWTPDKWACLMDSAGAVVSAINVSQQKNITDTQKAVSVAEIIVAVPAADPNCASFLKAKKLVDLVR